MRDLPQRCGVLLTASQVARLSRAPRPARARARQRVRLHVVVGGSHFPNRSHREEVHTVIGAFFDGIGLFRER